MLRRLTIVAWITGLAAGAVPSASQASPSYRFCTTAGGGTTYLLSRGHVSCRQARSLEREALHERVLRNGPYQTARWWSAGSGRWQTSARGKQKNGPYRGTWEYGIWSSKDGVNTCPVVYFFLKHPLRTVAN